MKNAKLTRKIGKFKPEPEPLTVQLREDKVEDLRSLKPEGNLFKDRFLSLQRRNIIEKRTPTKIKRRYKLKQYETPSYKRFM